MKRNVLTVVLCLLGAGAFAQLSVGVKGGLNAANLRGESGAEDIRPSFLAGAYLTADLSDKFSIQPELLYVSSGGKTTGTLTVSDSQGHSTTTSFKETIKLNYISVPVIVVYKVTSFLNIQAGPQINLLASAKSVTKYPGSDKKTSDIKDVLKSSDYGLSAGAGVKFGKFNASARYYLGLTDILDNPAVPNDVSIKTSGIQVAVGYTLFSIGK